MNTRDEKQLQSYIQPTKACQSQAKLINEALPLLQQQLQMAPYYFGSSALFIYQGLWQRQLASKPTNPNY